MVNRRVPFHRALAAAALLAAWLPAVAAVAQADRWQAATDAGAAAFRQGRLAEAEEHLRAAHAATAGQAS